MSEIQNHKDRDLSRFDSMSTEELQELLRLDAQKPVGEESDTDEIFDIMEVLVKRQRNESSGNQNTVEQAYESFVQNYMPVDCLENTSKKHVRFYANMPRWLRSAAVIVLVVGFLGIVAVGAHASDLNLFGMVATWTKNVFHFSGSTETSEYTEPDQVDSLPYASLQDALNEFEIKQKLAPTRMPDDYELNVVEVVDNPSEMSFYAEYLNGDSLIQISIRQRLQGDAEQVEKNEHVIEAYPANGVTYFIVQNNGRIQVTWTVGKFEGMIAGDITIDEAKLMINSI